MWNNPLKHFILVPTQDSESFKHFSDDETGLPVGDHPGAFGVQRKNHIHEGVDLYCPEGTAVRAVEPGVVVAVERFTGPHAQPPSPWWHDTDAVLVEGPSGVVVYGEITCTKDVGAVVKAGDLLGFVITVLTKDKGRPMSMLHMELHQLGTRQTSEWKDARPASLLDPTAYLAELAELTQP